MIKHVYQSRDACLIFPTPLATMLFNPQVKLSLAEKLDFLPALASVTLAAFYALLTGLWRSERQPKTLFLHLGYAILRKVTARMSPSQIQFVSPTSDKIYNQFVKKSGLAPQSVELGHGALGHWIGDRNAPNVLVWFHGEPLPPTPAGDQPIANIVQAVDLRCPPTWATSSSIPT